MAIFSPKIEIINHFDKLINRVDIDIDDCLEKFNDQQVLSNLLIISSETDRSYFQDRYDESFRVEFYETTNSSKNLHQTLDSFPVSTNVIDFLKQVRMRTIEELKKAQEDALECYNLNSSLIKSELKCEKDIDQLKNQLFADKFFFQINFTQTGKTLWAFNLFTFVTDFYLSPSEIESLE